MTSLREQIAAHVEAIADNYPQGVFLPDSSGRDGITGAAMRHAYQNAARSIREDFEIPAGNDDVTEVITEAGLVQAVADVIDPPDAAALAAKLFAWAPKMPSPPDGARGGAAVEYAHEMASGDYHLWNTEPWTQEIYPLADRIKSGQRDYGSVYWRRVVVIEGWTEVPESASNTTGKTP